MQILSRKMTGLAVRNVSPANNRATRVYSLAKEDKYRMYETNVRRNISRHKIYSAALKSDFSLFPIATLIPISMKLGQRYLEKQRFTIPLPPFNRSR